MEISPIVIYDYLFIIIQLLNLFYLMDLSLPYIVYFLCRLFKKN